MANPLFVSLLRFEGICLARLLLGEDRREAHSPEPEDYRVFPEPGARSNAHTFSMYARKEYASLTYRALCSVANLAALVHLVYFVAFKHRDDDSGGEWLFGECFCGVSRTASYT